MTAAAELTSELIKDFVDEALESLRPLPHLLADFRRQPDDFDPIHAVFRAVHSVKGCAGFLDLVAVKQLAHALENTLDDVRNGKLPLSDDLQRTLVRGIDALDAMLQRAGAGTIDVSLSDEDLALLDEVKLTAAALRGELEPEAHVLAELTDLADEIASATHPSAEVWCERVRKIVASFSAQARSTEEKQEAAEPPAMRRRPAKSYVGAAFRLGNTDVSATVETMVDFFVRAEEDTYDEQLGQEFLRHASSLTDACRNAGQPDLADTIRQAAADYQLLVDCPLDVDPELVSIAWERLEPAIAVLVGEPAPQESGAAGRKTSGNQRAAANRAEPVGHHKARMIRVREECVDDFLASVSSLFLTGELYKDVQSRMSDSGVLASLVEELRQINNTFAAQSTALQRNVVALRRVAASGLLSKFPQMARSLANQLGKQIDVNLVGQETEIDKSLVEDLDAPMTHMIRNVVDHAIESPEERLAAGKTESGTLSIKIEQTKTHVYVTIADDGRGINPAVLRAKASEKGVLAPEKALTLSDQEAIELIFHAGFSTAKQVSDVSGRGVGMDVVRTRIREHNGDVQVTSKVGKGTTFRLAIPLREAVVVIDGLLVRHAGGYYVLPFANVRELAELGPDEIKSVQGSRVATLRGETYDAVSLGTLLDLSPHHVTTAASGKTVAVLVGCKLGSFCILVDAVVGHRKVVVNSIKDILPQAERTAGVAQLGGGRLALVVSVQDILDARLRNTRLGMAR